MKIQREMKVTREFVEKSIMTDNDMFRDLAKKIIEKIHIIIRW